MSPWATGGVLLASPERGGWHSPLPLAAAAGSLLQAQHLHRLGEELGKPGNGGYRRPLQLAVHQPVIVHRHIPGHRHLQSAAAVQGNHRPLRHRGGLEERRPQGGTQLAGGLEPQPGGGAGHLRQVQDGRRHVRGGQEGVHPKAVEPLPQLHQVGVSKSRPGGLQNFGVAPLAAVPADEHLHRVLQLAFGDVAANLPQGHREEVQTLEADGLVGGAKHPAPLFQTHQALLQGDVGAGNHRPLRHLHKLQLLPLLGKGDGAVVHGIDGGAAGQDGGKGLPLLHPLAHRPAHVLREEGGAVRGGKELADGAAPGAAHVDVKPLELPLIGVQLLQGGAPVLPGGVQLLQMGGEAPAPLVHGFIQPDGLVVHKLPLLSLQ